MKGGARVRLETWVADDIDGGVLGKPACELERRRRLALDPHLERLEAAKQQSGRVRRRDRAGARPELEQPLVVLLTPADDDAEQEIVVAAEELRRAVEDEVGAALEGLAGGPAWPPSRPR